MRLNVIRWEVPPPSKSGSRRSRNTDGGDPFAEVADQLRARPGQWAVVYEGNNGQASGLASRIIAAMRAPAFAPAGSFEAVARKQPHATVTYARYVGVEAVTS